MLCVIFIVLVLIVFCTDLLLPSLCLYIIIINILLVIRFLLVLLLLLLLIWSINCIKITRKIRWLMLSLLISTNSCYKWPICLNLIFLLIIIITCFTHIKKSFAFLFIIIIISSIVIASLLNFILLKHNGINNHTTHSLWYSLFVATCTMILYNLRIIKFANIMLYCITESKPNTATKFTHSTFIILTTFIICLLSLLLLLLLLQIIHYLLLFVILWWWAGCITACITHYALFMITICIYFYI